MNWEAALAANTAVAVRAAEEHNRERALWRLAQRLWEEMERLAPGTEGDPETWDEAPEWERDLYYSALKAALMQNPDEVAKAVR